MLAESGVQVGLQISGAAASVVRTAAEIAYTFISSSGRRRSVVGLCVGITDRLGKLLQRATYGPGVVQHFALEQVGEVLAMLRAGDVHQRETAQLAAIGAR